MAVVAAACSRRRSPARREVGLAVGLAGTVRGVPEPEPRRQQPRSGVCSSSPGVTCDGFRARSRRPLQQRTGRCRSSGARKAGAADDRARLDVPSCCARTGRPGRCSRCWPSVRSGPGWPTCCWRSRPGGRAPRGPRGRRSSFPEWPPARIARPRGARFRALNPRRRRLRGRRVAHAPGPARGTLSAPRLHSGLPPGTGMRSPRSDHAACRPSSSEVAPRARAAHAYPTSAEQYVTNQ